MFDSKVYYEGNLIVGKMSGVVEPQGFINGIFWQIDSRNVGEVKEGFSQLYYDDAVETITVTDADIHRIVEINTGIGVTIGKFRTALVLNHPEIIRLARLHQLLAKQYGFEVEIFSSLEDGFSWLSYDNPEPDCIKLKSETA
ncbi:MAG: hypothetical protein COB77_05160 [Gammaproteobacteria bacterium]|nr:MAG: hypothetical protein COB77_05160 [Gammaproteobacteria bacterium]